MIRPTSIVLEIEFILSLVLALLVSEGKAARYGDGAAILIFIISLLLFHVMFIAVLELMQRIDHNKQPRG